MYLSIVSKNVCIWPCQTDFKIHNVHVVRYIVKVIFSYAVQYWKRIVPVQKNPKKI